MESFLKSKHPAQTWEGCFPLGNGSIGVMEEGNAGGKGNIYLNDSTLWSGTGRDKHRFAENSYKAATALVKADKIREAEKLIQSDILAEDTESYLPLGTLVVSHPCGIVKNYSRKLDFSTALLIIDYKKGRSAIKELSFVNHPDNTYVKHIEASKPQTSTFKFTSKLKSWNSLDGKNIYRMEGYAPIKNCKKKPVSYSYDKNNGSIHFAAAICFDTDGELSYSGLKGMTVKNYTKLTLYYASATTLTCGTLSVLDAATGRAINAQTKGLELLLERHLEDYTALFGKASLEINGATSSPEDTEAAIALAGKTQKPSDALVVTLFDFGRYLSIASSRKGGTAANLQGIWNHKLMPPWSSNYTVNINTEMNYWCQEAVGLSECTMPLYDLVEKIAESGKKVARDTFGLSGFVCGHNSDIWGHAAPVGMSALVNPCNWGYNISCSGWLAYHFYEHYQFTKDKDFLAKRALPIMRDALTFYIEYLNIDKEGYWLAGPGTSPENKFKYSGTSCSVSQVATIDTVIVRELMRAYIKSAEVLRLDDNTYKACKALIKFLPPYALDKNGTICEWYRPYEKDEPTHRHLSHLVGLYPMCELTPEYAPAELIEAAKRTLEERSDEGTGWSIAWRTLMHARLKDGDHALFVLSKLLRPANHKRRRGGSYPSLFGAHPPFQIDSNFGATAAITEMLVQSYTNKTELLPALPSAWKSGKVRGFRTRNGEVLNFDWNTDENNQVIITEV